MLKLPIDLDTMAYYLILVQSAILVVLVWWLFINLWNASTQAGWNMDEALVGSDVPPRPRGYCLEHGLDKGVCFDHYFLIASIQRCLNGEVHIFNSPCL